MTETILTPEVIAIISTVLTIVLGIITKNYKSKKDTAEQVLTVTANKAEKFGKIIRQVIAANADDKVTPEEFNGIIKAIEEFAELPESK